MSSSAAPPRGGIARIVAVVAGLAGLILAVLTPLLPVTQTTVAFDWPQGGTFAPVGSPLVQYRPLDIEATVPCSVLASAPPGRETVVLSTAPAAAGDTARTSGLFVTVDAQAATVRTRGDLVASIPRDELTRCGELKLSATADRVTASFSGIDDGSGTLAGGKDHRPQLVGLFSDLATGGTAPAGLHAHVAVDSRYSTTPSLLKGLAMIVGVLTAIASIVALAVLDRRDGRRARRMIPAHWLRVDLKDTVVVGALLIWHIVGAPTSDDGYILGMAKAALHSGYMPEVFRYYDAPYAPFGMPYYLISWMAELSLSSPWLRLPTLLAAIATWLLLSREVIPRLGLAKRRSPAAYHRALWAAAAVFLVFWLTYNPGLRPEPIVAFGTVLTWCCVERSIATRRLAPAAVGLVVAGLTLSAAPTGSFAFAVFVVAARPLWTVLVARVRAVSGATRGSRMFGYTAELAPLLAAACAVLFLIFGDHSLREMLESTHLLSQVGPSEPWFKEIQRYDALLQANPNGSIARRFSMFAMFACTLAVIVVLVRKRRIPGIAAGPARRVVAVIVVSLLLMMFNPTKWTHHFGAFAGFAAMAAAIAVVAVGPQVIRTARYRVAFLAALFAVLALCFESTNGWFYPGNYGIPWGGVAPVVAGISLGSLFALLALLCTVWAVVLLVRGDAGRALPERVDRVTDRVLSWPLAAPLTLATVLVVALIGASNTVSILNQYPAYSYGLQNLRSLAGHSCGQADGVLTEPDANAGMLTPASGPAATALAAAQNENFTPDGLASDLTATKSDAADVVQTGDASRTAANTGGTGGGVETSAGVNGSHAALPFGLDPARTPVLGSQQSGVQHIARAVSGWYRLPAAGLGGAPLLVVSAAGRFDSGGLTVEFGTTDGTGFRPIGSATPLDIGPAPAWRNLRVPRSMVPAKATAVRIRATVTDPSDRNWIAYTPPRVPHLETLQKLVGNDPVLVDWGAAIAFPCQRQWREFGGIAEQPSWRIQPERDLAVAATTTWEGGSAGGPLGWALMLAQPQTVATYLDGDWAREWGALERYVPYVRTQPAQVSFGTATRSGLWSPGPITH
ncbi:arabinosyltransferase domain-containing protein [Tsukamurella sp. 8F]|uniref:arabinosyltransferase domain-containing protein n=1 Tax=unclassified Tsukamurella TaxID=2633480 RepID=UPI0023B928B0|nr:MULTISPECIES: arabinosyltransferase domain-containing protein [unclassified Tsukamurella]MDF0531461.1 arabinosyltransferase domain-containing protein [Tsukamurella sp. 8J]MDF0587476.1 arabinosyltransferase domain-containing protein [Tsukamurella sp. 8F]